MPLHWAQTRGVRKRNPNGCFGCPSDDIATQWAKAARLSDIQNSDELCAVLYHAFSQANEISDKNGTDWEWWSYLTFRVEAAARKLAPRVQYWRMEAEAGAPVAYLDAKVDSEEFARPNTGMTQDAKAFAAWWRRLSEARRVCYGSVCSLDALSDFAHSQQPIHNLTESETSSSNGPAVLSAASGEVNTAHGDTRHSDPVSRSHVLSAAAEEEYSLRSRSGTGRYGTKDEASNA